MSTYYTAVMIAGLLVPVRLHAQVYLGWPVDIASRAPALADSITHSFGQRPDTIRFAGRDTLHVVFRDPTFWHDDVTSRELPMTTLPGIRKAALRVGELAWTMVGREAQVSLVRVAFIRVIQEQTDRDPTRRAVPTHEVSGSFTPAMLEAHKEPALAVVLRGDGVWGLRPATTPARRETTLRSGLASGDEFALGRAALADSIQREIGQTNQVTMKGPDTLDVLVPNPSFWWKYDTLKALPAEALPLARDAAKRGTAYIWTRHGQNPLINVVRVTFRRDYKERVGNVMMERPAQDVTALFTRQQLQAGGPETVQLTVVQR